MTVTISITNNAKYCDSLGLFREVELPPDSYDGFPSVTYREYPFELNLSNVNFREFWTVMGLDAEPEGEINPEELRKRLEVLRKDLQRLTAPGYEIKQQAGATIVYHGRTIEQACRYFWTLNTIVHEAVCRKERIWWG